MWKRLAAQMSPFIVLMIVLYLLALLLENMFEEQEIERAPQNRPVQVMER